MVKLILFDLGGVLCSDNRDKSLKKYTSITGLDLKTLHKRTFPGTWHLHDKGLISTKDCWKRILSRIPNARKLPKSYCEIGNEINERKDVVRFAKSLMRKHTVGMLSNLSAQVYSSLVKRKFPFESFVPRFISYKIKMRKPELQIYRHIMKKTGVTGKDILFIDDKNRNLIPARKFGWKTIEYKSLPQLKKQIKKFL